MSAFSWSRPLAYVSVIALVAVAYYIGRSGRGAADAEDNAAPPPDPGYAARDAQIIETGYDGRERYRLNARGIRQKVESGVIELESLEMNYHPGAQERVAGDADGLWIYREDALTELNLWAGAQEAARLAVATER